MPYADALSAINAALAPDAPAAGAPAPFQPTGGRYDGALSALHDALGPDMPVMPRSMAPPPAAPAPRSPYQTTMDALSAALAPSGGPAPDGDAPSTLTVQQGPTYGHTLSALSAALNSPPGTRIIMGGASPMPAGMTPRGAANPDPDSVPPSARLAASPTSDAGSDDGVRPLTIRAGQPDAPNPNGPLSNAPDDGWTAGLLKGAGTAAVKAAGNVAGFVGGLSGLEDYLLAKGQSVVTGQTVDQAMADLAARRAKTEAGMAQSPLGRLASATDPTKVLPAPDDVSGPILARWGCTS